MQQLYSYYNKIGLNKNKGFGWQTIIKIKLKWINTCYKYKNIYCK